MRTDHPLNLASRIQFFLATTVAERLDCSPPTKAKRVQSLAEFSRGSPVSHAITFRRCSILNSRQLNSNFCLGISYSRRSRGQPSVLYFPYSPLFFPSQQLQSNPSPASLLARSVYLNEDDGSTKGYNECNHWCQRAPFMWELSFFAFQNGGIGSSLSAALWGGVPWDKPRPAGSLEMFMNAYSPRTPRRGSKQPPGEKFPPNSVIFITLLVYLEAANRSAAEKRSRSKLLMKTVRFEGETTAIGTRSKFCQQPRVTEALDCSPPTKANRVQSLAGSLPELSIVLGDIAVRRVSSGISRFPRLRIPALSILTSFHSHRLSKLMARSLNGKGLRCGIVYRHLLFTRWAGVKITCNEDSPADAVIRYRAPAKCS
ncbi:hypothetical protein PR048_031109, partial [Dryococelus australis]